MTSRASGTRLRTVPPPRRTVLVVETDGAAASAWAAAIRELGVDVIARADVGEVRSAGPQTVVVLGSIAGAESAITLARELAQRPSNRRPRVVLVHAGPLRRIDRVHLDATIERPVTIAVLVAHVRRLLGLEERQRGLRAPTRVRIG
jgi:hypothetical protein